MMDWSMLPDDLSKLIVERLHSLQDLMHFRAVCRSWNAVASQQDIQSRPKLPWLMLTERSSSEVREFFSPSDDKVYRVSLPETRGRRCWGSQFGWLVTVGTDFEVHLLNPLSRVRILLPPLKNCRNLNQLVCGPTEFRDVFFDKVVISSSPSSPECFVMAIYLDYQRIAYLKLGDDSWSPLESSSTPIEDILLFKGKFLAIDSSQNLLVFDGSGSCTRTISFASPPSWDDLDFEAKYLLELEGEICMVVRYIYESKVTSTPSWRTWGFAVFKLDACTEKWKSMGSLDGYCLLLGNNSSFAVQASGSSGFKSNCIYFTDDYCGLYNTYSYEMGIFNFLDHRIMPYPVEQQPLFGYSLPLWFKPSLK